MTSLIEPLYSEAAEMAVLSAILIDPSVLAGVLMSLGPESFYKPAHQQLFRAMDEVYTCGDVIDPLTLTARLESTGHLEAAGGRDTIAYLVDVVPTAANVEYHAKIVHDLAERRAMVRIGYALIQQASDRSIALAIVAQEATAALLPVASETTKSGYRSLKEMTFEVMQDIEDAVLGKATGLSFGFRDIDEATGGIMRGELLMLGSVPGAGKTAAAINFAINAAERGEGVAIVSAEMKDRALAKRILSNRARVNGLSIRTGKIADHEFVQLGRAAGAWQHLPLWIDDTATPDIRLIAARARAQKAKHPEMAWLVVDFIQLIGSERDSDEIRSLALTNIAYALKGLSKELDVATIATFQVDASGIEKRSDKRPQLSDQRWSQGMREAADLMALAYRAAMYDDDAADTIELDFKKARELPPFKVTLNWIGKYMRMEDQFRPQIVEQQSLISKAS